MRTTITGRSALAAVAALALAGTLPARADTLFQTNDPEGGFFGYIGFDVFPGQSVAARFMSPAAATLDQVSIWFMSNDFDGTTPQTVTVSLRTNAVGAGAFTSIPSETILESWTMDIPVVGWNPALIGFASVVHPALQSGAQYWVVAESSVAAGNNPIWVWASSGNEFTATTDGPGAPWESGSGAAIGLVVTGTPIAPACPADIGTTGGVPGGDGTLDNNDFIVFIDYFFNSDPRADRGTTGGVPGSDGQFDNNDFIVFIDQFFAGCN